VSCVGEVVDDVALVLLETLMFCSDIISFVLHRIILTMPSLVNMFEMCKGGQGRWVGRLMHWT
jgi:hypothetical protein